MFTAFGAIKVVTYEYDEDCGPQRFPWVRTKWLDYGTTNRCYVFLPAIPLVRLAEFIYYWHRELRAEVAWRWFKSWWGWGRDDQGESYRCWKPYGFKPENECVPECEHPRWRDMAIYLWRRTKRVVGEREG